MSNLFNVALEYLKDEGWSFTEHEHESGNKWTSSSISAKNSKFNVVFDARENKQTFLVYVYFHLTVPEKNRVTVSELFTRLNFILSLGNFELDMNDGEVRYKLSVDVEGSELVVKMIHNMVVTGVSNSDKYFPAIMNICHENKTALEALAALDGDSEEDRKLPH